MSQYKDCAVGDTCYFWFAANDATGAAVDGEMPFFDVRLAGAAAGAAPKASGTPTLLTHANYTNGLFEIAIGTTGYAVGEYSVFCTLTISAVNPAGFVGSVKVVAAGTNLHAITAAIKAKTDLIVAGYVTVQAPAQTSSGGYVYCSDDDLDARYGHINVDAWADADADANAAKITARRLAARTYAGARFESRMRASPYSGSIPITDIAGNTPLVVVNINVMLAGYWLSTLRGVSDYDKEGNPLTLLSNDYREALLTIEEIVSEKLKLDVTK